MSAVHSLSDLKKRIEEEEKQKRQGFFTGGVKSGLSVQAPGSEETKVRVTLWANGFQVDSGPLRDAGTPEGQRFIMELNQKRVPAELAARCKGRKVALTIEDKREAVYEEQKARYTPFEGSGRRVSTGPAAVPVGTVNPEAPGPPFNPEYPQVTVLVKFHDGQKKEVVVNETDKHHAISVSFREFVMTAAPVAGDFDLMAGFPLTPLRNFKLTVQEADIANSSVLQKLL